MKSVYSAVRTGALNEAVCAWSLTGYSIKVRKSAYTVEAAYYDHFGFRAF
jgi:hypothetical protein